jgi:2-oxo-4-hydroxy-4-carboxy-5-ureidoimidazoline decarboxylase
MPSMTEINLSYINSLSEAQAQEAFFNCSGSPVWAKTMVSSRPFASEEEIKNKSALAWGTLSHSDWLQAFASHPKIGDKESLRKKFAATAHWAANEQGGVDNASEQTIERLALLNEQYEARFGYIFIVCATGKTAEQMLAILEERLPHEPDGEFDIACDEQKKITQLRLEKLAP